MREVPPFPITVRTPSITLQLYHCKTIKGWHSALYYFATVSVCDPSITSPYQSARSSVSACDKCIARRSGNYTSGQAGLHVYRSGQHWRAELLAMNHFFVISVSDMCVG